MARPLSVRQLIQAIKDAPSDRPRHYPGKWYRTQKEHWLGWLGEYDGPGAYGRTGTSKRDAEYAYNHIVEWLMLIYLARAVGFPPGRVRRAREAAQSCKSMQAGAAAVRRIIPWEDVEERIRDL